MNYAAEPKAQSFTAKMISAIPVQAQLNILGLAILLLGGWIAYDLITSGDRYTLIPLAFLGYVLFRVAFELTLNRKNVPTIAISIAGGNRIRDTLARHAAELNKPDHLIVDLGSGRGELTRRIARAIPKAQVLGIEIARLPYLQSLLVKHLLRLKNAVYLNCDFWTYDCTNVDAIVFYLTPRLAQKVGEKLRRELKDGSMVISHIFPLQGDWTPVETIEFRTPFKETTYVYRKGK